MIEGRIRTALVDQETLRALEQHARAHNGGLGDPKLLKGAQDAIAGDPDAMRYCADQLAMMQLIGEVAAPPADGLADLLDRERNAHQATALELDAALERNAEHAAKILGLEIRIGEMIDIAQAAELDFAATSAQLAAVRRASDWTAAHLENIARDVVRLHEASQRGPYTVPTLVVDRAPFEALVAVARERLGPVAAEVECQQDTDGDTVVADDPGAPLSKLRVTSGAAALVDHRIDHPRPPTEAMRRLVGDPDAPIEVGRIAQAVAGARFRAHASDPFVLLADLCADWDRADERVKVGQEGIRMGGSLGPTLLMDQRAKDRLETAIKMAVRR